MERVGTPSSEALTEALAPEGQRPTESTGLASDMTQRSLPNLHPDVGRDASFAEVEGLLPDPSVIVLYFNLSVPNHEAPDRRVEAIEPSALSEQFERALGIAITPPKIYSFLATQYFGRIGEIGDCFLSVNHEANEYRVRDLHGEVLLSHGASGCRTG